MKQAFAKQWFSFIFLSIFLVKMIISLAPLASIHLDSKIMSAVIMQLEIESNSGPVDQTKDSILKHEYLNGIFNFNFEYAQYLISSRKYLAMQDFHIESFFPSIPTPPPNC